jgi:hypothetical protein
MLDLTIAFAGETDAGTLHRPVVCFDCEALLFGAEDPERLAEVRCCKLRLLAGRPTRYAKHTEGCWYCSRPADPVPLEWQDSFFDELVLRNPRLCGTCLPLLGFTALGSTASEESQHAARLRVFAVLADHAEHAQPLPIAPERRRDDDLILAKLALVERDAHDYDLTDDGEGYWELAHLLGLSLSEGEAEVARLLALPEPPITLRPLNGTLSPRLNARGWLRVRGLQKGYAEGPPYPEPALRSRTLRRTLDRLAA